MVLRPSRDPLDCGTQQRMELTANDKRSSISFNGLVHRNQPHDLVVLKFPGTGGRAERSSAFPGSMLDGVSGLVLTWNPPGYGRSSGRASLSRIAEAADVFFAEVLDRHASKIQSSGFAATASGATSRCQSLRPTTRNQVDGLVLRNPPPLIPVVKRVALQTIRLGKFIKPIAESLVHDMNAELTSPLVSAPAVFLKSMSDSLVPPKLQDRLIDLYGGQSQVVAMEGLEHDGIPDDEHELQIQRSIAWLWQQSRSACKRKGNLNHHTSRQ